MESIKEIEKRREGILKEMEMIRSMRRGRVNEQYLKVPRKGEKEPVLRGPYYVFSRHQPGQGTKSYRLISPAEVDHARKDVEAHKRFQELCREYEELTEELGRMERALGEQSPEKKTAEVAVAADEEVKRFLDRAGSERGVDLESWEFGLRQAVLCAGSRLLEQLVDGLGSGRRDGPLVCECGERMESRGRRSKTIQTILGMIGFRRSMFVCPGCGASRFPGDEALDVVDTVFSPGLRRLMAQAGQRDTFKEGRDDLREFAAIEVTAKQVERVSEATGEAIEAWHQKERELVMTGQSIGASGERVPLLYVSYDGTGAPMTPWEVAGRKGKQSDGSSRTREVKLGCVFTQTGTDEDGWPVRDDGSTSFVGAIENSAAFGWRIYAEARRRGLNAAEQVVVIADGARYNWEIAALHFHGCVEIVDLYHAREHLHDMAKVICPKGGKELFRLQTRWRSMLGEGKVKKIIKQAKQKTPRSGPRRQTVQKHIGYFENNAHRMKYDQYRQAGLFVGSGVVEAGCKTVVGKRLKQSGMEWTVRGANSIIALRCLHLSGRLEEFYEDRAA